MPHTLLPGHACTCAAATVNSSASGHGTGSSAVLGTPMPATNMLEARLLRLPGLAKRTIRVLQVLGSAKPVPT
ncbi:hypothetical protein [Nannocystis pusilla]|uniref:hypothetical protein n=1 Tax=Nannocystis pusilla TaxID=889268 RepID=UPI003B7DC0F8